MFTFLITLVLQVTLFHSTVYPESIAFVKELFDTLYHAQWRPSPESLTSWAHLAGHMVPTGAMKVSIHCTFLYLYNFSHYNTVTLTHISCGNRP